VLSNDNENISKTVLRCKKKENMNDPKDMAEDWKTIQTTIALCRD